MNALTKQSTDNEIKLYFAAVLQLSKQDNDFPVNFDEVWSLVYPRKDHAVRLLKRHFMENVDYQPLPKNGERSDSGEFNGGDSVDYFLTISCMEFMVARKERRVFEVYRQVFHKVANGIEHTLPNFNNPADAARAWAEQYEQRQLLESKSQEQAVLIEQQAPKVLFSNAVEGAKSSCLVGELAKIIAQNGYPIGEKRLFEWMREHGYLGKSGERYNIPNQQYIEQGLLEIKKGVRSGNGGVLHTTITPKITGKGQVYFVNKFLSK